MSRVQCTITQKEYDNLLRLYPNRIEKANIQGMKALKFIDSSVEFILSPNFTRRKRRRSKICTM